MKGVLSACLGLGLLVVFLCVGVSGEDEGAFARVPAVTVSDTPTDTPTNTPTATNTPDPCAPVWSVVSSPSFATQLYGIAAVSANDIWAVGDYEGNIEQTFIEHWNGSMWSVVPSPNVGIFHNILNGVAAVSANDVWAVGYYVDNSNAQHTLFEHWDGTAWLVVPSPSPGTSENYLSRIAAVSANDVWAVGLYCTNTGCQTLTEHWNGSMWSVVSSPNPGTSSNELYGVAAIAANDIWAVGLYYNHNGLRQTLVEHWDGTAWLVVPSPNVSTLHNILDGVTAVSANDVWAVGYSSLYLYSYTLIEHWNGSMWSVVSSPNPSNLYNVLKGVAAISINDVWAVGSSHDNNSPSRTDIMHWDGVQWNVVPSANPSPSPYDNILLGISALSSNDIWAIGNQGGGQTLTEHYYTLCVSPTATSTPTSTPTDTPTYTPTITLTPTPTATCSPNGMQVLIVYADNGEPVSLRSQILAQPGVGGVDLFNARYNTPSLSQLLPYDVVVPFSNDWYADNYLLGNRLADYLDAQGVVVALNDDWYGGFASIKGRWLTDGYSPYNDGGSFNGDGSLGSYDANHPLMQGVTSLYASSRMNLILASGATQVAAWNDNDPLVVYKGLAIGISAYLGDYGNGWSGDFARIIVNAGNWLRVNQCPTSTPTSTPTDTPTNTPTSTPTPIIVGHVTWQGPPAQPNARQQQPITLTLKLGTTEVNYPSQNTDASGFFTVSLGSLPTGAYGWRVKGPKYLAGSGVVNLVGAPSTQVEMGLMRAGDANNDNLVSVADANVVRRTFGLCIGDVGYDGRGDFDNSNCISVVDFNLLRGNFGFGGAPPIGVRGK